MPPATAPRGPEARVDVDLAVPGTRYAREVFGHFVEHFHRQVYGGIVEPGSDLSDERGFRLDVVEAVRELDPPVVRWPGGCFVSAYHWLDGVGPVRRPHYDLAWRVTDPNTFETAEFVEWCRMIGAEPYLCTNAGTGTAEEMAAWVEYCNAPAGRGRWADLRAEHGSPEPFGVRWWSIGNENYGDWEIGAKTPAEWSVLVRESAKMMLRVDEGISLLTAARAELDWTLPLLTEAGRHLEMISIHGYWDDLWQHDEPSGYLVAVSRSLGPQSEIERTRSILGATGLAHVGIAFDEWNLRGWHHPDGTSPEAIAARDRNDLNATCTMADAVFTAGFLATCLRNADVVTMANIAPTVNTRGPLYVHPDGVVRRTTFHVLAMFPTLLGESVLTSTATSADLDGAAVPVLEALSTLHDAGDRVSVALVNRHPSDDVRCTVTLGGHGPTGTFDATVLAGDHPDAYNDVADPGRVVPEQARVEVRDGVLHLPTHSVTVLDLPLPLRYPAGELGAPEPSPLPWQLDGRTWSRRTVTPT